MTLLELTEPLFQYISRLNRLARRSGPVAKGDTSFFGKTPTSPAQPVVATMDYAVVRSEIKGLLTELAQKSAGDHRLSAQYNKMDLPLLFFIDSMIAESTLPFAAQWNQHRMAYERNELAGDEKFFELLEETLKDSSDDASERLAVYYTCVGLGFTGIYFRQPEYLRKTMLTIAPRIRNVLEADHSAKLTPEAYEKVDTRNLVQPPGSRLAWVVILFICFAMATAVFYIFSYRQASQNLSAALQNILRQDASASPQ